MWIGGKKLHFILSDISFKERKSNSIWIIQLNLLTFQCNIIRIPMPVCLWHAKKDIVHAWIVHLWIVYRELVQPYVTCIFWEEGGVIVVPELRFSNCPVVAVGSLLMSWHQCTFKYSSNFMSSIALTWQIN